LKPEEKAALFGLHRSEPAGSISAMPFLHSPQRKSDHVRTGLRVSVFVTQGDASPRSEAKILPRLNEPELSELSALLNSLARLCVDVPSFSKSIITDEVTTQ
jgi:hypothetical protein